MPSLTSSISLESVALSRFTQDNVTHVATLTLGPADQEKGQEEEEGEGRTGGVALEGRGLGRLPVLPLLPHGHSVHQTGLLPLPCRHLAQVLPCVGHLEQQDDNLRKSLDWNVYKSCILTSPLLEG